MGIFNKIKKTETKKTDEAKKASMKDLYKEEKKEESTSLKTASKKQIKNIHGDAYKILVKPLITEKAANLVAENKYIFAVDKGSNKIEIAKAINEIYGIAPISVNIIQVKGKKIRQGRTLGKRKDWKKAVITLPKGKTINIYEGV